MSMSFLGAVIPKYLTASLPTLPYDTTVTLLPAHTCQISEPAMSPLAVTGMGAPL